MSKFTLFVTVLLMSLICVCKHEASDSQISNKNLNAKKRMSFEEKIESWKGERVVLLPSRTMNELYPEGEESDYSAKLSLTYLYKPGIIVEVKKELYGSDPLLVIQLDGSNKRIVSKSELYVGFEAELTRAKSFVGKTLWTKGWLMLSEAGADPTDSNRRNYIYVAPTTKILVDSAGWGTLWYPVFLRMTISDGRKGDFYFGTRRCLVDRLHVSSESRDEVCISGNWNIQQDFFEKDPHKIYRGWDQGIWQSLEQGIIGKGMSMDMVQVACGEPVQVAVIVVNNKSNKIYSCRRYANGFWETTYFLIVKNKISKVSKKEQDLLNLVL